MLKKEDSIYSFDDYVQLRVGDFQKIYKRIRYNIQKSKQKMNQHQFRTSKDKLIAVRHVVFVPVHEINSKLALQLEGPYRVLDHEHRNKRKVRHLTPYAVKFVHLDSVKRVCHSFDSGEELPALQSNSDRQTILYFVPIPSNIYSIPSNETH